MHIIIIAFLALFVLAAPVDGEARSKPSPKVVVSILPLHSLVAGLMKGVGEPHLLVPGGASPHSFSMRPSDARRLEEAQAVFWVGPNIETFLTRPLNALARKARVVAMAKVDGVVLLPIREGGSWDAHDHDHDEGKEKEGHEDGRHSDAHDKGHDHGHGHGDDVKDTHVWLDPINAIAFVRAAASTLTEADPDNKERYAANLVAVEKRLRALDETLRVRTAPMKGKPYIVFHDAYHYFEDRYGLTPAGSITISPELSPGAKRLIEIRGRIKKEGALCVFAEPQFEPKLIRTVVSGTGARTGTLDPLGAQLTPGPDAYFQLLENLSNSLSACLLNSR
jgi:zinc transport system substrate-binding protein